MRKLSGALLYMLLLTLLPIEAFSQSNGGVNSTSFISQLQVEVKNTLIRLSWTDSAQARGPVYIYRSDKPFIDGSSYSILRPVEVPYGVGSYIDDVDTAGIWYYFVIASDDRGRKYDSLIPDGNSIDVVVEETVAMPMQPYAERGAPIPGAAPLYDLTAITDGDQVRITYHQTLEDKKVILYRSVKPVEWKADLFNAVIVQTGITSPFVDYPVPGIPYYYTVIFEEDLQAGTVDILPGVNASIKPVEVAQGRYRVGMGDSTEGLRTIPLPLMAMNTLLPEVTLVEAPALVALSPRSARAVGSIGAPPLESKSKLPLKSQQVFSQDMQALPHGEQNTLRSIVQGRGTSGR